MHDGGTSYVEIGFCPWCGTKLPASQRDRWWSEMERLGIDPWTQAPPPEYRTDAWFRSSVPAEPEVDPAEAEPLEDGHGPDPVEAPERSWVVAIADAGGAESRQAEDPPSRPAPAARGREGGGSGPVVSR